MLKPIEIVFWKDIMNEEGGWRGQDRLQPRTAPVVSTGFLISETDEFVVLAQDSAEDGDYNGIAYIPKNLITRRETVWTPPLPVKAIPAKRRRPTPQTLQDALPSPESGSPPPPSPRMPETRVSAPAKPGSAGQ